MMPLTRALHRSFQTALRQLNEGDGTGGGGGEAGFRLKGRGALGAIPEQPQSGRRGM